MFLEEQILRLSLGQKQTRNIPTIGKPQLQHTNNATQNNAKTIITHLELVLDSKSARNIPTLGRPTVGFARTIV